MLKINTILIALIIALLAAYAIYMNIQLRQTIGQYEAMNLETAKKFAKLSEERVRVREELTQKKVSAEEIVIVSKMASVPAVPAVTKGVVTQQSVSKPTVQSQGSTVRMTKKEMQQLAARERAEKAKAEVETMLSQVKTGPEPWEEREPHL